MSETIETRLARLEEAMVSVKGDTLYLRKNLENFQERQWERLVGTTGKLAGLSAVISLVMGVATVFIAHVIWR